jgi:hypothetical protein
MTEAATIVTRCLIPEFDGAIFSLKWKEALWDRYYTAAEHEKPHPDLRQIDWDAVRNTKDIDVCVFRIASSIQDVEYIKLWLTYHNFEVVGLSRRVSKKYVPSYETDPTYFL